MVFRATERYRDGKHLGKGSSILIRDVGDIAEAASRAIKLMDMCEVVLLGPEGYRDYDVASAPVSGYVDSGLFMRGASGRAVKIL